jgi:hypothetical protein
MRQFTRREEVGVQFYFECPEKMDRIIRMLKRADYKDLIFTVKVACYDGDNIDIDDAIPLPRLAELKVKFGKGWMGKDARIRIVDDSILRTPKGIRVFITMSKHTWFRTAFDCAIKSLKDNEGTVQYT